ncbi:MAG: peptidyl-prolyl cis-trans isomerase [Desulfobacteraceae bacterium]|nr:peptidyl-prolyl cis-trans isomerase [Desulfobacteraceae bacterium]
MLRLMRENVGNWIIKFFLGIIVIVFVFFGFGSLGSKRDNSVASINDEPITIQEYQQAYKRAINQLQARFGKNLNDDILKALNVKQQALDSLIEDKIILAEANKLEIIVSDRELQENLLSQKAFQRDGKFDLALYKRVLGLSSMNPEIYERIQINALRNQKVRNMVLNAVNVSDMEARNWFVFQNSKVAVDYITFRPDDYTDIKPDEEQIKKLYDENKDSYKSESKRKAIYLKFSPEDYKDKVLVTDDHINAYYEQNIEEFKIREKVEARHILIKLNEDDTQEKVTQAQKKALDIYEMAVKGQDFEKLAKQYSEGPSKKTGGYLGTFEKQSMVKPFADAAFSMKAGEISKPVRTRFGWHIIKVVAKFDASTQTVAQATEKIKKDLEKRELQNLAYYAAGEAFDSVIDGDDFEQVALISNKKIIETNEFNINGKGLDFAGNSEFAKTAFDIALDNISDVKQFGDSYYLIKVVKRIDPVVQEFNLVRDSVLKDLTKTLQDEKAKEDAQGYASKAFNMKSFDSIVKEHELKVNSTKLFTRNSNVEGIGNSPDFIAASFSLNTNKPIYPKFIKTSAGYSIIAFKEIKLPEESEILENLKNIKKELSYKKQASSYQAWLSELKKDYKIKYDPKILN